VIPELGKYAVHVLSAYGVTLGTLGLLTWASVSRWRRLKREVERQEAGRG
jgi:heme exporter protein D